MHLLNKVTHGLIVILSLPSVHCTVRTTLEFQPLFVCLFLSVLISHTDAERGRWGTSSHTHTQSCVLLVFSLCRGQVTIVMRSLLFIRAHLSSSSAPVTALHHHHHMTVGRSACSLLCLSDRRCSGRYLSWTARRTLSTWSSCAVWASRSVSEGKTYMNAEHQTSFVSLMYPSIPKHTHLSVNMGLSHTHTVHKRSVLT